MTHLKNLGLPIALAALLSAPPLATADGPGDPPKPTPTLEQTAKELKELKEGQEKSTKQLLERLDKIQDQLKPVEGLRKDVDGLKESVQNINRELTLLGQAHNRTDQDLIELRTQLKQAREDLARVRAEAGKMQDQIADLSATSDGHNARISKLEKKSQESATLTLPGTIRLFNTSGQPVTILVNGVPYPVDPGKTRELRWPLVGPSTYEVQGVTAERKFTLTADKPFDIEVFDPAVGPVKTPRR